MKLTKTLSSQLATAIVALSATYGAQAAAIQAEDYSAFFDTTPGNTGGAYRADDVDIEGTSDAGGGHNVGWIESTEWLAYNNINFPEAGSYTVEYRVASAPGGGRVSLDLNAGSIQLGALDVPATGGWQNWTTISHNVNIPSGGTYSVGVFAVAGGWNLNWIRITKN